jgi:hypothetical protein
MDEIYLPMRIMLMIKELHNRGYSSIYLYSGLSPSGMHWRYEIGQMVNNQWPARPVIDKGSLQNTGEIRWAVDNSTVDLLADGFESYYKDILMNKEPPNAYTQWYANLIDGLNSNELLVFFADYGGAHEELLKTAPNYHQ